MFQIRSLQIRLRTLLGTAFGGVLVPLRIGLTIIGHGSIEAGVVVRLWCAFTEPVHFGSPRKSRGSSGPPGIPFRVQTPVCSAVVLACVCVAACLQVRRPFGCSVLLAGLWPTVVSYPSRVPAEEASARRLRSDAILSTPEMLTHLILIRRMSMRRSWNHVLLPFVTGGVSLGGDREAKDKECHTAPVHWSRFEWGPTTTELSSPKAHKDRALNELCNFTLLLNPPSSSGTTRKYSKYKI